MIDGEENGGDEVVARKRHKTTVGPGVRRAAEKSLADMDLQGVRICMVEILGRVGGDFARLITGEKGSEDELTVWDIDRQLFLNLPFDDCSLRLDLDSLLPRLANLAEHSPDRKVKVTACELLHSVFILMIGNHSRGFDNGSGAPLTSLFRYLFPTLIRTAGDFDTAAQGLSKPVFPVPSLYSEF